MKKLIFLVLFLPLVFSFDYDKYEFDKVGGGRIKHDQLIFGSEKTVLFFWTSWCSYCRRELKKINQTPLDTDNGIKFYYVNIGENNKSVDYIIDNLKLNDSIVKNILLDKESIFVEKYKILGIPTYVFLKDGKMIYKTNLLDKKTVAEIFQNE